MKTKHIILATKGILLATMLAGCNIDATYDEWKAQQEAAAEMNGGTGGEMQVMDGYRLYGYYVGSIKNAAGQEKYAMMIVTPDGEVDLLAFGKDDGTVIGFIDRNAAISENIDGTGTISTAAENHEGDLSTLDRSLFFPKRGEAAMELSCTPQNGHTNAKATGTMIIGGEVFKVGFLKSLFHVSPKLELVNGSYEGKMESKGKTYFANFDVADGFISGSVGKCTYLGVIEPNTSSQNETYAMDLYEIATMTEKCAGQSESVSGVAMHLPGDIHGIFGSKLIVMLHNSSLFGGVELKKARKAFKEDSK